MTKWVCDECCTEYKERPTTCSKCGCPIFNEYMEMTDVVNLKLHISELVELVNELADGTERGDYVTQVLVSATPQEVRDFINEELRSGKT